jgi:hypothetical protein
MNDTHHDAFKIFLRFTHNFNGEGAGKSERSFFHL